MTLGGYREGRVRGTCAIPGCPGIHEALGYCGKHYQRLTKIGSLEDPRRSLADADRLWAQAERAADGSGCLLWTGAVTKSGYSQVWWEGKTEGAHRIAYLLAVGEIPPGYQVDHVRDRGCQYSECIEPAHLEAITHEENQRRKVLSPEQRAAFAAAGRKGSESRWRGITDPAERFWKNSERATDGSGCLLWQGYVAPRTGYGTASWHGSTELVHRLAWKLSSGMPIPKDHDVDHVRARGCRHKHCIEPAHLEAVPMKINRGRRAHPAVPRELLPERPRGPGRRRGTLAVQGGITKIAPEIVAEMRELLKSGLSQAKVGKRFGVSQMTVSRAVRDSR